MSKEIELCETVYMDKEKVLSVKARMPKPELLDDLALTFKALANPVRIRILQALVLEDLCVCDLANLLNMSISAISHHLRILRMLRVVKFQKKGLMVYYSLDDAHIEMMLEQGLDHVKH